VLGFRNSDTGTPPPITSVAGTLTFDTRASVLPLLVCYKHLNHDGPCPLAKITRSLELRFLSPTFRGLLLTVSPTFRGRVSTRPGVKLLADAPSSNCLSRPKSALSCVKGLYVYLLPGVSGLQLRGPSPASAEWLERCSLPCRRYWFWLRSFFADFPTAPSALARPRVIRSLQLPSGLLGAGVFTIFLHPLSP